MSTGHGQPIFFIHQDEIGFCCLLGGSSNEQALINQLITQMKDIPAIQIYGDEDPQSRIGMMGFTLESVHPHDIAMILDESSNIQVRSGYLCAHPFIQCLNETGLVQVSLHGYNSSEQIDIFVQKLTTISKDLV